MPPMAAKSPGQKVRPRKPKEGPKRGNTHRWEPFTNRIARLKIDPIHDLSKRSVNEDPADYSLSHFSTALDEWAELNLSATFTSFLNRVNPLCENLPQLLHHADAIVELLLQYIQKKDELALEPLLSLTAHLAHDLGKEFEKYFARSVSLIAEVAATHDQADVVEWCFTSIAWLLKYLSRLLVHDLRPLLGIMRPYLSARKDYIARFSAESLAFLLRKAAVLYPKRKAPLSWAVKDLLQDAAQNRSNPEHHGLLTLLVESCLGVEGDMHSSAGHLVNCLLNVTGELGHLQNLQLLLESFVVGLVHRTNSDGFEPVLSVLLTNANAYAQAGDAEGIDTVVSLLEAAIGTRKGSRIQNWRPVLETCVLIGKSRFATPEQSVQRQRSLSMLALVAQYASIDQLLPYVSALLDGLLETSTPPEFFGFCTLVADLGKDRFHQFLLARLQKYVVANYANDEAGLIYLLEHLCSKGTISKERACQGFLHSSTAWDESILERLSAGSSDCLSDEALAGIARLPRSLKFPVNASMVAQLGTEIQAIVVEALKAQSGEFGLRWRISVGWLLEACVNIADKNDQHRDIWEHLLRASSECYRLQPFVEACTQLAAKPGSTDTLGTPPDHVLEILTQNMMRSSVSIKISSLKLLQRLYSKQHDAWLAESLDLLLEISSIDYLPANMRRISMLLRRLPQQQRQVSSTAWLQRLIPFFCIGLLSIYHDQSRRDVCSTLGELLDEAPIQETVFDILSEWLRCPPTLASPPPQQAASSKRLSPFECSNLKAVQTASSQAFEMYTDPGARMRALAEAEHQMTSTVVPEHGRSLALEALSTMPAIAERRSRMITPVFLNAQFGRSSYDTTLRSDTSTSSHTLSPVIADQDWSFPDRRAFVKLLGQFQNPKVLFRSQEVHDKLLDLLQSGNAEIRKLALMALLNWKDPVLHKHENALFQIIEEKAANAEIGAILNADADGNPVQAEERPTVLPVLLRLLYGSLVGRSGTYGSQEARRRSILRMLFRMHESEVVNFLTIALGELANIDVHSGSAVTVEMLGRDAVPLDRQYGFLRLMLSFLEILQSQFAPFGRNVIDAVLYCTLRASHQIETAKSHSDGMLRNTRRTGVQCLEALFEHCPGIQWKHYMPLLFTEAISPRLDSLPVETAQGISALLRMFSAWSHNQDYIPFFRQYDPRLPKTLWQCLMVSSAKSDVTIFILKDILQPLLQHGDEEGPFIGSGTEVVSQDLAVLLQSLSAILQSQPGKDVLLATTAVILDLAPLTANSNKEDDMIRLLVGLLADSKSRISPLARGSILGAIQALLQARKTLLGTAVHERLLDIISSLFNYFRDPANRIKLSTILKLVLPNNGLQADVTSICSDMNVLSTQRLDKIDYDRRLNAFQRVSSLDTKCLTANLWRPIVYNLLFFSRDEDFSIRSNATSVLKHFIIRASAADDPSLQAISSDVILPAVRDGIKEDSEVIRSDMITLFGLLVQYLDGRESLQDLRPLFFGNDEEASFFSNILHVQQHRRLRAIRRLTAEVEQGTVRPSNIAHFFIPLLMKFVRDQSPDDSAQSLKGQSLQAMRTLLKWVEWKQFKAIFKQIKQELENEGSAQRTAIKVLNQATEALLEARQESLRTHAQDIVPSHLARSLPSPDSIASEVKDHLLTKLADFIHYKDEVEMSSRLPAATIAVRLIKLLPVQEISTLAAPIVLDIANVLRSKASESRDAARRTLTEIVNLLGPSSVLFVLKELRNALQRGYQLHVLSYTLHSILVTISASLVTGDLDYCLKDLVAVIMDDTFGVVGQEKENQDYISSMKEVKSSKSFDSMELVARSASMGHLTLLLDPIVTILTGTLTSKQIRHVDELLRRIGIGLARNPAAGERDLLTFAYQAIQCFYKEKPATSLRQRTNDERNRDRFLIKNFHDKSGDTSSSYLLFKIARFAIDNVRSAFQKHADLMTPENVHGFLPVIGDALVEAQEDVKTSALRLLSAVIKLRMPELDKNAPLYVLEAVKVVRHSNSTNDEVAQAALKLVAGVLRERKAVKIRDNDVAELLRRITPDLEEPDRQGVTFNFIRAVMSRKYQVPEIYDLVDKIGIMMVTNQSHGARGVARGVYVHFLLEYPQSPARWTKQQKFLIKNLEFEYPEGRESIMEAVNMLLNKASGDVTQQLISSFFVPIVLRMANEEHQGCRDLAGQLLGQVFRKASLESRKQLLEPLYSWIDQGDNASLRKIGMQAFVILFDVVPDGLEAETKYLRQSIAATLELVDMEDAQDLEMLHQTLQLMLKLAETRPSSVLSQESDSSWKGVCALLQHRDPLVQSVAASLISAFFRSCKPSSLSKVPLTNTNGLKFEAATMRDLLKSSVRLMKKTEGNAGLSESVVSVLAFLGRCADTNSLTIPLKARLAEDSEADAEADENDDDPSLVEESHRDIPAIQYLLDQCALILRRELPRLTSAALLPKSSALTLLTTLVPQLSLSSLPPATARSMLLPLIHVTNPNIQAPRSADPAFLAAYSTLVTSAQEVMDALQTKVGDQVYIKAMTEVSKVVRDRREERKRKRVIERVAEPERHAQSKKRKGDRKKEREREVSRMMGRRRKGL